MKSSVVLSIFYLLLSLSAFANDFDITIAKDGSGDYSTIQEALNSVPDFRKKATKIHLKPGIYKEKLTLSASKTNIHLIGDNAENTVISYDDYASKKNNYGEELGTIGSASFFVFGENFLAKNITFENSSKSLDTAVSVFVDGDKAVFENCRFLGFRETLYAYGKDSRQYYKNCYIEGTNDFIIGPSTAVFDSCEIYTKEGGQFITAAATEKGSLHGFVFINCKLTGDATENSVYLGRPSKDYAQTVFVNCHLGSHIKPEGWHNWDNPKAEEDCFYAEYRSIGPGAAPNDRVLWSWQLTRDIGEAYTPSNILKGKDDWNPLEIE